MLIKSLRLISFRAHAETQLEFGEALTLLHGPNGSGKTNILEAIHYLCLTKSFLASHDAYALRRGSPYFEVEGTFEGTVRSNLKVRVAYVPDTGKRVFLNGVPLERLSDLVGAVPVVLFSPEDQVLTAGGPDERRRLLNNILSQSRPVYLDDTLRYRRALRQRNELLAQARRTRTGRDASQLEAWDEELVSIGSRIVLARHRFVRTFAEYLDRAYAHIAEVAERPSLQYATLEELPPDADEHDVADRFRRLLRRLSTRERERGLTLAGPHRDDLVFYLNDFEVRRYASQGQHRTFGMALKLAQALYLHDQVGERPILLLDDVFDHLDARRADAFLRLIVSGQVGQAVLTATRTEGVESEVTFDGKHHRALSVEAGHVSAPVS